MFDAAVGYFVAAKCKFMALFIRKQSLVELRQLCDVKKKQRSMMLHGGNRPKAKPVPCHCGIDMAGMHLGHAVDRARIGR